MNIDSNHPEHLINNINIATQNLAAGYSCSEAVLLTYAPLFNLPSNSAFKIASGFGGGMAMGETCGAVTAAFMVIGLRYGADNVNDSGSREHTGVLPNSLKDSRALPVQLIVET